MNNKDLKLKKYLVTFANLPGDKSLSNSTILVSAYNKDAAVAKIARLRPNQKIKIIKEINC